MKQQFLCKQLTVEFLILFLWFFGFAFLPQAAVKAFPKTEWFHQNETVLSSYKNSLFPNSGFSDEDKAENFTLSDQFGKNIAVRFPSDKVVVLIFGDREGSAQVEKWVRPLYEKFNDRIYIFGVAELSAVPWAVRPVVRGIIKSKSKDPIMLDWSGKVSKKYGCEKGKANVFVINKDGVITAVRRGAADNSALDFLAGEIRESL